MPVECVFTLPAGKKCRCMATRGHAFCRHHGAPRTTRPRRNPDAWSRRACWRDLGRSAAHIDKDDSVIEILGVLRALRENRIADRTAGRLLRVLLQVWDEVPLEPVAETGWVWRDASPSAVAPASAPPLGLAPQDSIAPVALRAATPFTDNEMLTLERLEKLTGQLCAKLGADRQ
jgi:hypothetical protein